MIEDLDMIHYEILQEPQGRDKPQGEKAKIALRKCAMLAEYYFLAGDKQKAETLLRQLGHKDKHIKKFLKIFSYIYVNLFFKICLPTLIWC